LLKGFNFELSAFNFELKGVEMSEAVQQKIETSPESRASAFEPEVLAFCCEH
jgi:hypothetical protein